MDRVFVRVAWALVLLGAAIVGGAAFLAIHTAAFVHAAATTEGTVVRFHTSKKGAYAPVVRYTAGSGDERTNRIGMATASPAYAVGERVTIYYDPADPDDARIGTFVGLALPPLILGGVGVIFGAPGVGMLAVDRRVRRKERERQRLAAVQRA